MAYNLPLKLHTTTLSTGTSHAAKPFTGYDETKAALNLLKNISNEEDLKNKFQKIQDFSNNSMMRGGRQNLPDVSTINFQRFDQTFMKGDFLCPAQYELMQYIDPGQYNSLGLNKPEFGKDQPGVSALIKQGFDDEE
ncbi:MAG: hypothetical protein VW397_07990, partial [Candidatus Margulisiibacteriota bacterium]